MLKKVLVVVVLIIAALVLPRQIWLAQLKHRAEFVRARQTDGCNIPCLDRLLEEMKQVNFELEHPPWYVVGGVGSVQLDK